MRGPRTQRSRVPASIRTAAAPEQRTGLSEAGASSTTAARHSSGVTLGRATVGSARTVNVSSGSSQRAKTTVIRCDRPASYAQPSGRRNQYCPAGSRNDIRPRSLDDGPERVLKLPPRVKGVGRGLVARISGTAPPRLLNVAIWIDSRDAASRTPPRGQVLPATPRSPSGYGSRGCGARWPFGLCPSVWPKGQS
jgi:hypothetical protein